MNKKIVIAAVGLVLVGGRVELQADGIRVVAEEAG